uniref:Uncharacterized protein n=1 Tax=Cyclophora tenuis TaxID=216820 RepID=A0A7S1GIS8_CYCTE|mmetsp:Transcript_12736/g.21645  ORF Transcript_12736/g.21645 Transcript_12736/m.21645 type:complete len:110 (+) Transcript_12736:188-517(+)|eukprot:CAMPEP_0116578064 /NCGR_PEP_ID=MMETSP0397-20121206/21488_1 /TAXON_ID=216820 /ORGANISM="Cyclophora tenuis, Strain ECT3854" /LENGTH=109 /DNA_ID=CAMNT_0004107391 /DNA_START=113 /DNA_END=442 /DNA_ORIENTATION=+
MLLDERNPLSNSKCSRNYHEVDRRDEQKTLDNETKDHQLISFLRPLCRYYGEKDFVNLCTLWKEQKCESLVDNQWSMQQKKKKGDDFAYIGVRNIDLQQLAAAKMQMYG